jgi:hypothetical protein
VWQDREITDTVGNLVDDIMGKKDVNIEKLDVIFISQALQGSGKHVKFSLSVFHIVLSYVSRLTKQ